MRSPARSSCTRPPRTRRSPTSRTCVDVLHSHQLHTPIASFTGHTPAIRVGVSPIMRSGNAMVDAVLDVFPEARVYHLGLYRDRESLQATE